MKYSELRDQMPSVEMIPVQNVCVIIYGCCVSIVVMNKAGRCTLDVLTMICDSNVVGVLLYTMDMLYGFYYLQ